MPHQQDDSKSAFHQLATIKVTTEDAKSTGKITTQDAKNTSCKIVTSKATTSDAKNASKVDASSER